MPAGIPFYFAPKRPERAGINSVVVGAVSAAPTVNATTTVYIPVPVRKCRVVKCSISSSAIPADADGTILFNLIKYDASATADVTLVSSADLETLLAVAKKVYAATLVSSLTAAQLTLDEGDSLRFTVVSNSAAYNTAPTDVAVSVELAVLE